MTKRSFDRRVDGLISEDVDGELVVVVPASGEAHALNGSAAVVFELCDGATGRAEMAEQLAARCNLPAEVAVVELALAELVDAGLVVPATPLGSIGRRQVLRRLGMTAAAAAMLPVVDTMVIRPAAAISSVPLAPVEPQGPVAVPQAPHGGGGCAPGLEGEAEIDPRRAC